jgi:hypothetical protein
MRVAMQERCAVHRGIDMTETVAAEPVPAEAAPVPEAESEADDTRTPRQKVLDHLVNSDRPQTVAFPARLAQS